MDNFLTESEERHHNMIVEHNAQLVNDKPIEYPEDRDIINELADVLYKVPIVHDVEANVYYQVVEFEDGEQRVDIDRKFYPYLNLFM